MPAARPVQLTNAQVMRSMQLLGLTPQDFQAIQRAPSFEDGEKRLAELKLRTKSAFRKAALDLHPDRNPDPAATEDFKIVSVAAKQIEELVLHRPPPPQPRPMGMPGMQVVFQQGGVRVVMGFGGVSFTGTSTTTTTASYWRGGFGF